MYSLFIVHVESLLDQFETNDEIFLYIPQNFDVQKFLNWAVQYHVSNKASFDRKFTPSGKCGC